MNEYKIDFGRFMHVGVVVHNIEAALERMQSICTLGEHKIIDFPPKEMKKEEIQLYYQGEKTWYSARFCFIKMGVTEIELIEPVDGPSVWKDFLRDHGEGIHHLKYEVDSLNESIRFFKSKGIACIQYGSAVGANLGKTWAYFDTTKELGYIIEALNTQLGELVEQV